MRYMVIIERAEGNLFAYSPQVPGCVATGQSREEVLVAMGHALAEHLGALREAGEKLPLGVEDGDEVVVQEVAAQPQTA